MALPPHKTKIVCTIGPASESSGIIDVMIRGGMNVARLNFSHGDFESHGAVIEKIRSAVRTTGRRVAIMADLPGPRVRIGMFGDEFVELKAGDQFTLTTEDTVGDRERVSVNIQRLPELVKPGDTLFLNDGLIQLEVTRIEGDEILCRVIVGGQLRSKNGMNLPGIDLGVSAFTDHDRECLRFALEMGVDAVSQSFVEKEDDVFSLREAIAGLSGNPFIIAKIERRAAIDNIEEILQAADGIMIARGDLGVEIPIEGIALVQKHLMEKAILRGKPVITATQMLESMVDNPRPTRAEATDVSNAILDGTDCVMLSGESAMGKYPVEAVAMLSKIAEVTEPHRSVYRLREALLTDERERNVTPVDLIASSIKRTLERVTPAAVIVPTVSGYTARKVTRFRLPAWITAVSPHDETCQALQFSYGVHAIQRADYPEDWNRFARDWVRTQELEGKLVIFTEGPSPKNPEANNRLEIIDLERSEF